MCVGVPTTTPGVSDSLGRRLGLSTLSRSRLSCSAAKGHKASSRKGRGLQETMHTHVEDTPWLPQGPSCPPAMSWGAQLSLGAGYREPSSWHHRHPRLPGRERASAVQTRRHGGPLSRTCGEPELPGASQRAPAVLTRLCFRVVSLGKSPGASSLPSGPQSSGCRPPLPLHPSPLIVRGGGGWGPPCHIGQWSWICPVLRACHSWRRLRPCHPSDDPICPWVFLLQNLSHFTQETRHTKHRRRRDFSRTGQPVHQTTSSSLRCPLTTHLPFRTRFSLEIS